MKTSTTRRAGGRAATLLVALLVGLGIAASPAAADGTWTYTVTPNPIAPGESLTISGVIEGCDFLTPPGSEVSIIITDPDLVQYGPFVVVPANTATNSFSYTFPIPAGGPTGAWHVAIAYTGLPPTGCAQPGAEQMVDVLPGADSPALALVPAAGLVGAGGIYLAARRRLAGTRVVD